ncbi:hypothetical protein B0A49_04319 [Cryomyces minteri]|uniref:protein-tyrosine-phosphatase n=1 Tax=Cryomyces minteri TaxID=331657 RepID=A0A4U0X5D5_9PEZI|nr:hypothetical protein B0A49_04319 [Cryomyces minteri]
MRTPDNVEDDPAYQRWLYRREIELSRACGQAPEADKIRFEDEHANGSAAVDFDIRCRKCRRTLATSQYLIPHAPKQVEEYGPISSSTATKATCAHHFVDPLSWMRPELEQGKLDGRLECPKCRTNVGKYAWQGMQCSCGDWVVPGISLAKGRIDEVKSRTSGGLGGAGIRLPPASATRGSGQENL